MHPIIHDEMKRSDVSDVHSLAYTESYYGIRVYALDRGETYASDPQYCCTPKYIYIYKLGSHLACTLQVVVYYGIYRKFFI